MAYSQVMSTYVKKLSHPLREIRERSLQLLVAKLRLGWELEDELSGTRELLEALLAWFHVQQPSLQREALHLLLSTIKTKAGTYIAREFGIKKIISTLNKVKTKIDADAMEAYVDVLETLRFLNTVESAESVAVPPLTLNSLAGSESDGGSRSSYCNLGYSTQSSEETSVSPEEPVVKKHDVPENSDVIKVLLFPWEELCSSDSKTMLLVEDALKLLKSTRRCCRFICDVFLQDFPVEIFLNRPSIIKSLVTIADSRQSNRPGEALLVLLCITRALRTRLKQLSSLDLIHEASKLSLDQGSVEDIHIELEEITGDNSAELPREGDPLAALKQLPAPLYALDTLHTVLSIMARNIALVDPVDKTEVLDLKELNTCLNLIDCLIQLLLDCIGEGFWRMEHNSKTLRDIAHKSCMAIRLLGDLLTKYRKSFYEDTSRCHHRVAWLRLVTSTEILLYWARNSALPPSSAATALQMAQLDPTLELLYPKINKKISTTLQHARISPDQEYKSKYREMSKLYASMEKAAEFMMNRNCCRNSKKVLDCIKKSLPVLELHLSEAYLQDISDILLKKTKEFDLNDRDWCNVRSVALILMAHKVEWVQAKFYRRLVEMVRSVLVGDEQNQAEDEKSLMLLCDVGVLTEICCHGMSSNSKEVETCASDIMLYLLRGRLVLSEACWWRLLASLLPVMPLLHVYAAHETQLGQAICKSLEPDIAECMGVSLSEVATGLVRLLFVRCPSVQLDAAHSLCRLMDDERYLPPRESLRVDILVSALRRLEPQDFNVDYDGTPSTTGLMQILDVLKQDIVLDEHGAQVPQSQVTTTLEPSLRRSMLQQLSVIIRRQELHDTFLQCDGLRLIVAILRMSMMVDDYLAFPECAISCVSVLNSVCFTGRHGLAKIPDLPLLLLRVILVFPANDSAVQMSAQILALIAWSGFALQELNASRHRVPALPHSVTQRTTLPFIVNSYWITSPNVEHSSIEWLLSDEDVRAAVRMHWWCACEGSSRVLRGAPPPPAPLSLRPTARDLAVFRAACPVYSCTKALLDLENATSHKQVNEALSMLESYTYLLPLSSVTSQEFGALPWHHTRRFLCAPPASSRDTALLMSLLRFILAYMDNVSNEGDTMTWIKSSFIETDASVISLLSRDELYLEQTSQESIEITQLHIHIVKVLLRCIKLLEYRNDYDSSKLESLIKILLACLKRVDLTNFHMLGYLNELVRCIRYAVYSRHCKLSEDTLVQCMRQVTATLAGCASGGSRKGQACRLDALLSLLAMLNQVYRERLPVQRWSEAWNGEVVRAVTRSSSGARPELRAAALHVMAALAHYTQMLPHLLQAIPMESLSQYATSIFAESREANIVRSAAAALLTALSSRSSPHTDVLQCEIMEHLKENNFLQNCLDILVDFCNDKTYDFSLEPNVPCSLLERRSELEVRAQKCGDVQVSPSVVGFRGRPPPTPTLVASVADVLYNVSSFRSYPVQAWNERGLYRLLFNTRRRLEFHPYMVDLPPIRTNRFASTFIMRTAKEWNSLPADVFPEHYNLGLFKARVNRHLLGKHAPPSTASSLNIRCASWSKGSVSESNRVRLSTCRTLYAAASHKCVRSTLAITQDCLLGLFATLTPFDEEEIDLERLTSREQSLLLIAILLSDKAACATIWRALRETASMAFFLTLVQCLRSDEKDLQDAALYCLTYLAESASHKKHPDKSSDISRVDFFDNIKSPLTHEVLTDRQDYGDRPPDDCQPEYMAEELLKLVIYLYQKSVLDANIFGSQDERWHCISTCLSSLLSASPRCRQYGVHRQLPRVLLGTLQTIRDRLSLQGSADVFRAAHQNPAIRTLNWLLILIDCHMVECIPAKENFAEDGLAVSLNRLWPWCMLTPDLRDAIMHLLLTFSNDCEKSWAAMSSCIAGRTLVGEVCSMVSRESTLQSKPRSDCLLLLGLRILRHLVPHHHCRAIILKSEAITSVYKLRVRERTMSAASSEWAKLCESIARHLDGAGALLALRPILTAPGVRAQLMPALAHVARHRRSAVLQAPDLLQLLSGTLLAGDTAEVVSATRAVWALAANNHKAKLLLRSAGIVASVHSALQRLQRMPSNAATKRALQLLLYTNSILQTT